MKPKTKKKKKKFFKAVGWTTFGATLIAGTYIVFNKPNKVENPTFRTRHRADGIPKIAFDKAWQANLQSVKQLVMHGEICTPYQDGDKFFTGHTRNARLRNINPFKQ